MNKHIVCILYSGKKSERAQRLFNSIRYAGHDAIDYPAQKATACIVLLPSKEDSLLEAGKLSGRVPTVAFSEGKESKDLLRMLCSSHRSVIGKSGMKFDPVLTEENEVLGWLSEMSSRPRSESCSIPEFMSRMASLKNRAEHVLKQDELAEPEEAEDDDIDDDIDEVDAMLLQARSKQQPPLQSWPWPMPFVGAPLAGCLDNAAEVVRVVEESPGDSSILRNPDSIFGEEQLESANQAIDRIDGNEFFFTDESGTTCALSVEVDAARLLHEQLGQWLDAHERKGVLRVRAGLPREVRRTAEYWPYSDAADDELADLFGIRQREEMRHLIMRFKPAIAEMTLMITKMIEENPSQESVQLIGEGLLCPFSEDIGSTSDEKHALLREEYRELLGRIAEIAKLVASSGESCAKDVLEDVIFDAMQFFIWKDPSAAVPATPLWSRVMTRSAMRQFGRKQAL